MCWATSTSLRCYVPAPSRLCHSHRSPALGPCSKLPLPPAPDSLPKLQRLGWSWLQSLSFAAALSIAVTALAVWRTIHYFDRAGLHATRRQLSRLGIGDECVDEEEKSGAAP